MRRPGKPPFPQALWLLRAGWGNEKWAAELPFLKMLAKLAAESSGDVVEAGSGASTILLSRVLGDSRNLYSLEHNDRWRERVNRFSIGSPAVSAPLVNYGDWDWYQLPLPLKPQSVGLVVCDGPPSTTKGGRFGALPVLEDSLMDGALIILDDAGRSDEAEVLERWAAEFDFEFTILGGSERGFAVGEWRR